MDRASPASLESLLLALTPAARQALRLRRFGVAALSYVLATAMMGIAWAFGVLPLATVLQAALAFIVVNLGLYFVIRSGLNLRFADPSLTQAQMLTALTILMYIVFHMEDGREVALFACFVVFLFGIFRLTTRQSAFLTAYTLGAYALVIHLLVLWRPAAIHDVSGEWMTWLGLAGFLPCCTLLGGQISALRRRMRESESRLRILTEMSADFYWETDAAHRIAERLSVGGPPGAGSLFRPGVAIGERRWDVDFLSPDEAGWRAHRDALEARLPFRDFEHSRLGPDGCERHISISGDAVFDASGAFAGYQGIGTDISERKHSEQLLRDSARQLRAFADNIPAMTVSWDEHLRCTFANRAFCEFFDVAGCDVIGRNMGDLVGHEIYLALEAHIPQAMDGYPVTDAISHRLPGGEVRCLEVRIMPHLGEQGALLGCFSVITDITVQTLAAERIQRVAHHDDLTGLPNRILFHDRLDQSIKVANRSGVGFALLFLDLDRFKPVNDELGHAAGDELLKAVAGRITGEVREADTVARVGGDEFTVILLGVTKRDDARIVATKIAAALGTPFTIGSPAHAVGIGASIGIALYPRDAADAHGLVKAADTDMYIAKQAGTALTLRAA
jgi:diguanylate cyclase (GGDEF)-like protein/PAS domain S-box-containing protein